MGQMPDNALKGGLGQCQGGQYYAQAPEHEPCQLDDAVSLGARSCMFGKQNCLSQTSLAQNCGIGSGKYPFCIILFLLYLSRAGRVLNVQHPVVVTDLFTGVGVLHHTVPVCRKQVLVWCQIPRSHVPPPCT